MMTIGVHTRIHTRASTLLFDVPIVFENYALNAHGNLATIATMTRCVSTARLVISMENMTNPPELLRMASIFKRITCILDPFTGGRRGRPFFFPQLCAARSSRQKKLQHHHCRRQEAPLPASNYTSIRRCVKATGFPGSHRTALMVIGSWRSSNADVDCV